ncbi:MAG: thioredoxin [Phycisphaerae bacterium]
MTLHTIAELSELDFDRRTAQGVTLVDFWAPWCGPCRMQAPALEAVAEAWAGRASVAKVNVDANPALAGRFRVSGIPLLVVLKDGQEVQRLVGLQSAQTLSDVIQQAL